jgi:hypothetical protein
MFYAPGLAFGGTEGVRYRFHVLRPRTRFRRYRRRRVPFSCFTLADSFSAVLRASGFVFMICAPELIFEVTEGVGSRFNVLRARTRFWQYRGRRVPVFMFYAPGLILGCTEGVGSRFHVLRSRTRILRKCGCRLPFSCFALPDSLSAVLWASAPVFISCSHELIFGGTDGVGSDFHVLRSPALFRRCGGRRVPFSCFAPPDSFSTVPRATGPVIMFCTPVLIFGGTEGVGSQFKVLRARTRFRLYRGRLVLFSCFALPDSFSVVPRASAPVFMFCVPGLVFGGTEGVVSRFPVLRSRTHFRRC